MKLIGIDFSLNSTAVTIFDVEKDDIECLSFLRLPANWKTTRKYNYLQAIDDVSKLELDVIVSDSVASTENDKLLQCLELVERIIKRLPTDDIKVALEGFAFSSIGLRGLELAGYQYHLRTELIKTLKLNINDLYVFPPSTVKKTAGGGRYKKEDMMSAFLRNDLKLHYQQKLGEELQLKAEQLKTTKDWKKPIDDVVDSFYVVQTLINLIKKQVNHATRS